MSHLPVSDLKSEGEALGVKGSVVVYFYSQASQRHLDAVFDHLCIDTPHARFFRVDIEKQPNVGAAFQVSAVPVFLLIKDGKVIDKLQGANPAELANKVTTLAGPSSVKEAAPASLGMAAAPAVLEAVQELAKENGGAL